MNKFTKWIIGIVVIILIILGIKILTQKNSYNIDTIKIGALAPLTGQASVLGERIRNGMELARQDLINEGMVSNIEIIYEDACDPKTSIAAVQKLINIDQVPVIGSSFCLIGIDAISPMTESRKIILFNTAANPESTLNKKYLFSTNFAIRDDAQKIAEYSYHNLHARTASIIHFDTSFGKSYQQNFTQYFEQLGGKILFTAAKPIDATDFRAELTKVKDNNSAVLIIIHFGTSLGNALKQARELGIDKPILGSYESEDPTVLNIAGVSAEGLIISSSQPKIHTTQIQNFQQRYSAIYDQPPDVLASNAYDAVRLQVISYLKCNGNPDCMAVSLRQVKNYPGVSGSITINPDNSTHKNTIFKIVKDGEFVEIENNN